MRVRLAINCCTSVQNRSFLQPFDNKKAPVAQGLFAACALMSLCRPGHDDLDYFWHQEQANRATEVFTHRLAMPKNTFLLHHWNGQWSF